jgi:hypothetical protein
VYQLVIERAYEMKGAVYRLGPKKAESQGASTSRLAFMSVYSVLGLSGHNHEKAQRLGEQMECYPPILHTSSRTCTEGCPTSLDRASWY